MIKLKSLLKEYNPTRKATMASPKSWTDNMWNASGNLLNVVYWLSSLQLKAPKEIKSDSKLKGIINNLKKLERQLDKWYDKTDFENLTEGTLNELRPMSNKPEVGDYFRTQKVFGKIVDIIKGGREIEIEPVRGGSWPFVKAVVAVTYLTKSVQHSYRNGNMERNVGRPIWTQDKKYWKKK